MFLKPLGFMANSENNPVLNNMINFYECADGFLGIDTKENNNLTVDGITYVDDAVQEDMGSYDGLNDSMGGLPSILATNPGSWSCTFSTTDVTRSQALFADSADNDPFIILHSDSTSIRVRGKTGSSKTFVFPTFVNDQDYNLMITKSTSNLVRAFINGIQSSTGGLTITGDAQFTVVGARTFNSSLFLGGRMTRIRRWTQENTTADAAAVSNADLYT